jgi:hypothetical protein
VREAFDIGKAEFEFGQDFEDAFSFVFGARAFGDVVGFGVGSVGVSDWARGEHRSRIHAQRVDRFLSPLRGLLTD